MSARRLSYEDVFKLSDIKLRKVLNHLDNKTLLNSLGDDPTLVDRVQRLLSPRALVLFQHDLAKRGTIAPDSISNARKSVEATVEKLVELGALKNF